MDKFSNAPWMMIPGDSYVYSARKERIAKVIAPVSPGASGRPPQYALIEARANGLLICAAPLLAKGGLLALDPTPDRRSEGLRLIAEGLKMIDQGR